MADSNQGPEGSKDMVAPSQVLENSEIKVLLGEACPFTFQDLMGRILMVRTLLDPAVDPLKGYGLIFQFLEEIAAPHKLKYQAMVLVMALGKKQIPLDEITQEDAAKAIISIFKEDSQLGGYVDEISSALSQLTLSQSSLALRAVLEDEYLAISKLPTPYCFLSSVPLSSPLRDKMVSLIDFCLLCEELCQFQVGELLSCACVKVMQMDGLGEDGVQGEVKKYGYFNEVLERKMSEGEEE